MNARFFIFTRNGKNVTVTDVVMNNSADPATELQNAINALTAQGHVYLDTVKVS